MYVPQKFAAPNQEALIEREDTSVPGEGSQMVLAAELDDSPGVDLAVASYFGAAARVLFNDGTGVFDRTTSSSTGGQVESIAAGDWDGDDRLDLVTASSSRDGIDFIYNESGGIASFPRIEYVVSDAPRAVAAADLNGDGFDDVAYATGSGVVGVMLNSRSEEYWDVVESDVGGAPVAIQIADVDADAHPDLIVADAFGGISVFTNDAQGGFASRTDYAVGKSPRALAIADLDGDGHLDLAVGNHDSSDVSLLFNSGAGTFEPAAAYPVPGYPRSVVATDLDRDGDLDLAVASDFGEVGSSPGLSVSVLFNQGCHTFGPALDYYGYGAGPVGPFLITKGAPHSLAAADLNDDGWVDLAVANGNHLSVLFGSCVE